MLSRWASPRGPGRTHLTRRGFSTRRSILRLIRCRRVGPATDLHRTITAELEPSGQLGAYVASGTRIMYRSTDARGNPVAVTGTYFEPDNPWPGNGPRPLISLAVATTGKVTSARHHGCC